MCFSVKNLGITGFSPIFRSPRLPASYPRPSIVLAKSWRRNLSPWGWARRCFRGPVARSVGPSWLRLLAMAETASGHRRPGRVIHPQIDLGLRGLAAIQQRRGPTRLGSTRRRGETLGIRKQREHSPNRHVTRPHAETRGRASARTLLPSCRVCSPVLTFSSGQSGAVPRASPHQRSRRTPGGR